MPTDPKQRNDKVFVSEHGPRGGDEINIIESAANYGWPIVSAGIDYSYARVTPFITANQFVSPIYGWTPSMAPGGLAVYRGDLFASWEGDLLVPVMVGKAVRKITYREGQAPIEQVLLGELNTRIGLLLQACQCARTVPSDPDRQWCGPSAVCRLRALACESHPDTRHCPDLVWRIVPCQVLGERGHGRKGQQDAAAVDASVELLNADMQSMPCLTAAARPL